MKSFYAAAGLILASSTASAIPGFNAYNKTPIVAIEAGKSHVRLANFRDEPVKNYVDIYGIDDKQILGSFELTVPAKASIQFTPETMIQTFAPVNYNQRVVLYVENGREAQLWQHIKFDNAKGTLADASVCTIAPHIDYAPIGHVVLNAHTSRIGGYVSNVAVHNFSDDVGNFEARLTDSKTGRQVGVVPITVPARGNVEHPVDVYEELANFKPAADQMHINIQFVPKAPDSGARLSVSHTVTDVRTGAVTNLSNPCAIHGGIISLPAPGEPQ